MPNNQDKEKLYLLQVSQQPLLHNRQHAAKDSFKSSNYISQRSSADHQVEQKRRFRTLSEPISTHNHRGLLNGHGDHEVNMQLLYEEDQTSVDGAVEGSPSTPTYEATATVSQLSGLSRISRGKSDVQCLRVSDVKLAVCGIFHLLTLGLSYLLLEYVFPSTWQAACKTVPCLENEATHVLFRADERASIVFSPIMLLSNDGLISQVVSPKVSLSQRSYSAGCSPFNCLSATMFFRYCDAVVEWDRNTQLFNIRDGGVSDIEKRLNICKDDEVNKKFLELINPGDDEGMVAQGYREKAAILFILVKLSYLFTGGLSLLFFYWLPVLWLKLLHTECSAFVADRILLTDDCKRCFIKTVRHITRDGVDVRPKRVAVGGRSSLCDYFACRMSRDTVKYFSLMRVVYSLRWDSNAEHWTFGEHRALLDSSPTLADLQRRGRTTGSEARPGLSSFDAENVRALNGFNEMYIALTPIFVILFKEVLTPFYIFQVFSVTLWFVDEYEIYASTILIVSVASLVWQVYLTRKNELSLRRIATGHQQSFDVLRPSQGDRTNSYFIDSTEMRSLVPGDVMVLPRSGAFTMPCDAVLLSGTAIVNEAILTGESVPVTKVACPGLVNESDGDETPYSGKKHSRHTLMCGTRVIQTKYYANQHIKAVVVSTGFQTTKGALVRTIMFPKPKDFEFILDSFRYLGVLGCIAAFGFVYSLVLRILRGEPPEVIILRCLDLLTIVVPPALPIAMSIGYAKAQMRLERLHDVYCTQPTSINFCGVVTVCVFDKTGTLTEDGLDLRCVLPVAPRDAVLPTDHGDGAAAAGDVGERPFFEDDELDQEAIANVKITSTDDNNFWMLSTMATCHSLSEITLDTVDSETGEAKSRTRLVGDPMDIKMFKATGWTLEETLGDNVTGSGTNLEQPSVGFEQPVPTVVRAPGSNLEWGLVRQFDFSSDVQRMSVIARCLGNLPSDASVHQSGSSISLASETSGIESSLPFCLFVKGAPEKIATLCRPETVPVDFVPRLNLFTRRGFRVLALAYRTLDKSFKYVKSQKANRNDVEKDLTMIGLLVMENRLKSDTRRSIRTLREGAGLRTVMCTGDNLQTAVSVARQAGLMGRHARAVQVEFPSTEASPNFVDLSAFDEVAKLPNSSERRSKNSIMKDVEMHETKSHVTMSSAWQDEADDDGYCLVMTGDAWSALLQREDAHIISSSDGLSLVDKVLGRGVVFARFSPAQKRQLVEMLNTRHGHYVSMCGDGANDCQALKAAHAGISLIGGGANDDDDDDGDVSVEEESGGAEASAAAPFTSTHSSIKCVVALLREGRSSLVTSFGMFQYIVSYSLIQFTSVCLFYWVSSNLTDFQFLYIDLFLISTIYLTFSSTPAFEQLVRERPPARLVSAQPLVSLFGQMLINFSFQLLGFFYASWQPWYIRLDKDAEDDKDYLSFENWDVFVISCFQYIAMAIVMSKGPPFRKTILSNPYLIANLTICAAVNIVVTLVSPTWMVEFLELLPPPQTRFRIVIFLVCLVNFLVCQVFETLVIDSGLVVRVMKPISRSFYHFRYTRQLKKKASTTTDQESNVDPATGDKMWVTVAKRLEQWSPPVTSLMQHEKNGDQEAWSSRSKLDPKYGGIMLDDIVLDTAHVSHLPVSISPENSNSSTV